MNKVYARIENEIEKAKRIGHPKVEKQLTALLKRQEKNRKIERAVKYSDDIDARCIAFFAMVQHCLWDWCEVAEPSKDQNEVIESLELFPEFKDESCKEMHSID